MNSKKDKACDDAIYPFLNELVNKFNKKCTSDAQRDLNSITRVEFLQATADAQNVLKTLDTVLSDFDTIQLIISNNVINDSFECLYTLLFYNENISFEHSCFFRG
jgi:hypothetical protein